MARTSRLWIVLAANLTLVAALVVVGVRAHSVGVYAEGADYLGDAAAIGVSLLAIHLASRPPTPRRPRGHPHAPQFAAAVNAGWLLILSLVVAAAAIDRLITGARDVHGLPVLVISGIAAVAMLGGALLLAADGDAEPEASGGAPREDLNLQAVVLETAADAAAAAGVAMTGALIYVTGRLYWLDPAVALLIATAVSYQATRLLQRIRRALAPR